VGFLVNKVVFGQDFIQILRCFSVVQQPNSCLGRLFVEVSRSHTIRHTHTHTRWDSSEQVISFTQRPLPIQNKGRYPCNTEAATHAIQRPLPMQYRGRYQCNTEAATYSIQRPLPMQYRGRYQCNTEAATHAIQRPLPIQ
jgi:hypothetical protein